MKVIVMRMEERLRHPRRRRLHGRSCPGCGRSWAVRAEPHEVQHPSGARVTTWLLSCRFCQFRRATIVVDTGNGPRLHSSRDIDGDTGQDARWPLPGEG